MRPLTLLIFALAAAVALWLPSCGETAPREAGLTDTGDTAETARRVAASFYVPEADRIPSHLATNPGTPWGEYVGSSACRRCHVEEYEKWRKSFHSRTLYDAVEATVFGDFSGDKVFDDPKFPFIVEPFSRVDPTSGKRQFYMTIMPRADWPAGKSRDTYAHGEGDIPDVPRGTTQRVVMAFGNRRHQPYVFQWKGGVKEGRYYVAPITWNDIEKRWMYDGFRPYVSACAQCHVTGIKTSDARYDPRQVPIEPSYPEYSRWGLPPKEEGWADGAVGCEVCHGPGLNHVREVERVGVERYRELLEAGKQAPTIYDGKRGTFLQRARQCGQCHDFMTEAQVSWIPKPHGFDRDPIYKPIHPLPGERFMLFYPDGSHKSPCTVVAVYSKSKMWNQKDMEIGCTLCHDAHGNDDWAELTLPIKDNSLCLSCHDKQFPDAASVTRHSRHQADSLGNRCVECHMPRHMIFTNGVQSMSDRIHSHEMSVPKGGANPQVSPPTACNVCHTDRSEAWTAKLIDAWWQEDRARAKLAPPGR